MAWQDTGEGIGVIQFTMAMLAVYIAVFLAELTGTNVAILSAYPWRLGNGELWRLLTTTTIHGSILHFAFNLMMFYRLNQAVERWLGPWAALGIYVYAALASGTAQIVFAGGMPIGASGVVYALFGFLWVCRRRYDIAAEAVTPQLIQTLLAWLAICAVVNFFGGHIANSAHIVGLASGYALGQMVIARRKVRIAVIAGTVVVWLGLISFTYKPVWEKTIGRIPLVGDKYASVMLPEPIWRDYEAKHGQIDALRAF